MASDVRPSVPLVRPLVRGGRARRVGTGARSSRWMNYVFPLAIVLANVALAWSADQEGITPRVLPLLFGVVIASLFEVCRRNNMMSTAAVLILTDMAYIFKAGNALSFGVYAAGDLFAPPDSVVTAFVNVTVFLVEMTLGALALERMLPASMRASNLVEAPANRRVNFIALLSVVGIAFLFALAAGTWSAYGTGTEISAHEEIVSTDFHWQMLYEPTLLAAIGVMVDDLLRTVEAGRSIRSRKLTVVLLGLLALLLFIKQVRRFMAFSLVISLLQALSSPYVRTVIISRPRRFLAGAVLLLLVPVVLNVASLAWRRSSRVYHTSNMADRLSDTAARLSDVDQEELESTSHRFTYLAVDSAAVEYRQAISHVLELNDLAVRSIVLAIPKVIFRGKNRFIPPTCETAFAQLHPTLSDMACSPMSEGYIAAGFAGVLVVAVPFAILSAIASVLLRRRTVLSVVMGINLTLALCSIEGGAFTPGVYALRGAILDVGAMAIIAFIIRGLLGRAISNVGTRRRPRRAPLATRHA